MILTRLLSVLLTVLVSSCHNILVMCIIVEFDGLEYVGMKCNWMLEVNHTHQIIHNSMEDRTKRRLSQLSDRKRPKVSVMQIR